MKVILIRVIFLALTCFIAGCTKQALIELSTSHSIQNYRISQRGDGGYDLQICVQRRFLLPIPTAEGFFPTHNLLGLISLRGYGTFEQGCEGFGFYYHPNVINTNEVHNECLGYVYFDKEEGFFVINLVMLREIENSEQLLEINSAYNGKYNLLKPSLQGQP